MEPQDDSYWWWFEPKVSRANNPNSCLAMKFLFVAGYEVYMLERTKYTELQIIMGSFLSRSASLRDSY